MTCWIKLLDRLQPREVANIPESSRRKHQLNGLLGPEDDAVRHVRP